MLSEDLVKLEEFDLSVYYSCTGGGTETQTMPYQPYIKRQKPSTPKQCYSIPHADTVSRINPALKTAFRPLKQCVFLLVLLSLLCTQNSVFALSNSNNGYVIEIVKSQKKLLIWNGKNLVKSFKTSTGSGGKGDKHIRGDKRTPIGTYRIVEFNPKSRFHYFMHLNYPNVKDAFYGLKNKVIDNEQFYRITKALKKGKVPPQNTPLGGLIGIHGIGSQTEEKLLIHDNINWTEGCIALTNEQVMELRQFVAVGTKVIINE